jgi:hypothetical protein
MEQSNNKWPMHCCLYCLIDLSGQETQDIDTFLPSNVATKPKKNINKKIGIEVTEQKNIFCFWFLNRATRYTAGDSNSTITSALMGPLP